MTKDNTITCLIIIHQNFSKTWRLGWPRNGWWWNAVKPEDWDENQPKEIVDDEAGEYLFN